MKITKRDKPKAKIKYIAKVITEDGLLKSIKTDYYGHKIPLDKSFDTQEELIAYVENETGSGFEGRLYDENIAIFPVLAIDMGLD